MSFINKFLIESVRIILPLLIVAAGVGGLAMVIMNRKPPPEAPDVKIVPQVEVSPVQEYGDNGTSELKLEVDGIVVPYREVNVGVEVSGKVIFKNQKCKVGKTVRQGNFPALGAATVGMLAPTSGWANVTTASTIHPDHPWTPTLLVEIDPRDYLLEIKRLQSELAQAEANLVQNDVEAENTNLLIKLASEQVRLQEENYNAMKSLFLNGSASDSQMRDATEKKITAENSLEILRSQLKVHKAKRNALEDAVEIVQDRLDKAHLDLERTRIWAPTDGKVTECMVEAGSYVQKGAALLTIEDTSAAEVRSHLTAEEIGWLWQHTHPNEKRSNAHQLPSARAQVVYMRNGQEFIWEGILSHYDGSGVEKITHTYPCRILVSNPHQHSGVSHTPLHEPNSLPPASNAFGKPPTLFRNMYVKVRIYVQPSIPLLQVDEQALKPGNVVWRIREEKLDIVPIEVLQLDEGKILVSSHSTELKVGDRLILTPIQFATEGVTVQEKRP